jgi:hypothetical protein
MTKEMFALSEAELKGLTEVIKKHPAPKAKGVAEAQAKFCQVWPQAKTGLELLNTIIVAIPGVGPFAKAAIGIVIGAGDAASAALCK